MQTVTKQFYVKEKMFALVSQILFSVYIYIYIYIYIYVNIYICIYIYIKLVKNYAKYTLL